MHDGHLIIDKPHAVKYLECLVFNREVKCRISLAEEALNRKRRLLRGPLDIKRMVKCFVWSVLLYEAETWTLWKEEERRLHFRDVGMEKVERIFWKVRVTTEEVPGRVREKRIVLGVGYH